LVWVWAGLLGILLLRESVDLGQRKQKQGHAESDGALKHKTRALPGFAAKEKREQGRAVSSQTEFHIPSQRLQSSRHSFRGKMQEARCGSSN
jgi:hypothetical protein